MFGRILAWYIVYTFSAAVAPWRNFAMCKFTLRPSLASSYIGSVTARHSSSGRHSSAKLCVVVQAMELRHFHRRRHLYSAGRPSRWASARILVSLYSVIFWPWWQTKATLYTIMVIIIIYYIKLLYTLISSDLSQMHVFTSKNCKGNVRHCVYCILELAYAVWYHVLTKKSREEVVNTHYFFRFF